MFGFPEVSEAEMRKVFENNIRYITKERSDTLNSMFSPEVVSCDPSVPKLCLCFPITEKMLNTSGIAHGGVISMAYDITMGTMARWFQNGRMSPTLTMSFEFIKPVPSGRRLILEAQPVAVDRHTIDFSSRGWIEGAEDVIVNRAAGRFFIYDPIKFSSNA